MSDAGQRRETVIRPMSRWVHFDLKPLWDYRDLVVLMVRRDFVSRFRQTILGPLWFIINPLVSTLVFTVIFGKVAALPTDGLPQPLFYNCGLLFWGYFSSLLGSASGTFSGNAAVFSKVYFPRLVIPIATSVSTLFTFGIQLLTFFALFVAFKLGPAGDSFDISAWSLLIVPLLVLQSALIAMGVGFWIAALTVRYRDLSQIVNFIMQLWMYATPVIYPLSRVPSEWMWLASLNPVTSVIELARYFMLGSGTLNGGVILSSVAATLLLAVTGLLAFQRAERTFVDTV